MSHIDKDKCLWFPCIARLPLQLKDTAERILAVDRAAAMVEEMLKQGQSLQPASSTFHLAISNGVKVGMCCIASIFVLRLNKDYNT